MEDLQLQTISRNEARWLNRIFSRNGGLSFSLGQDTFDLLLLPGDKYYKPKIRVQISAGENQIMIGLEEIFFMDRMKDFLEGENFFQLPGEIRDPLLEAVLEEWLDRFEVWSGTKTSLRDTNPDPTSADMGNRLFFSLVRRGDGKRVTGHFTLDRPTLEWLAGLMGEVVPVQGTGWDHIPVRVRFEVGKTRLALGEFNKVERDDIIFLDECGFQDDQKVIVRLSPNLWLKASLEGKTVIVQGIMEGAVPDKERKAENGQQDQKIEASSMDEVPIDLIFELGEKKITLGDLKGIQPGHIFDLENDIDKPVSIRANGKIIGLGRLLQVDDRVGVRVIELFER